MREFKVENKTFIKSNNSTTKIYNRYLYCLIPFILLAVIYSLITHNQENIINIIKSFSITTITCIITQYIFNIINKKKNLIKLFKEDQTITLALILGLFSTNVPIVVIIVSSIITIIIKNTIKSFNLSSVLYGILTILIFQHINRDYNTPLNHLKNLSYIGTYADIVSSHGSILKYLIGINGIYLSPVLSIIAFVYLLHKKSIKYNIVFSYILTISLIMLSFGLLNNMNIWFLFFQLATGNLLFLTIFSLPDYQNTPISREGQIIYGIILAVTTSILRFIIPELSVVVTLIIGPIILTRIINKISFKLRYHKKFYLVMLSLSATSAITTIIILNILIK